MAGFGVSRAGAILAASDFERSLAFYRDLLGFEVEALYDDPPYAILSRAGMRLSLQYHERKDEWIHVLSGRLRLLLEDDAGTDAVRELGLGDGAHVPAGRRHRYEALERCELIEVSTPELDDVIRLSDDYGREGTSAP